MQIMYNSEKVNNTEYNTGNKTTLVQSPFYDIRPGNNMGLFYNTLKSRWDLTPSVTSSV